MESVLRASLASRCMSSNMVASSGESRMRVTKSRMCAFFSASGMFSRAARARRADLFSSSFFSYSCLTAFGFTCWAHVLRSGSMSLSRPI